MARLLAGTPPWLMAIASAALAARLILAWQPLDTLVGKATPDDAYYYFQLARNIVRGDGPSLDGLNATNGFHPLWLTLLLPLAGLGREAFVHAALTLGALIDTATIFALFWALAPITRRLAVRIVAVSFYAFNPAVAFSAVNGMESSLSLFTIVLLLGLFLRSGTEDSAHYRYWMLLGAVGGLSILARTDNALFVLALLAFLVLKRAADLRPVLMAGVAVIAVTLPWFAWNTVVFGTPIQVSGEAGAFVPHQLFDPDGSRPLTDHLGHGAKLFKSTLLTDIPDTYFFAGPVLATLAGTLTAGTAIAVLRSSEAKRVVREYLPMAATAAVALVALVAAHAGLRWFVQVWYFLPAVPIAALLLALALEAISTWLQSTGQRQRHNRYIAVGVLLATLVLVVFAQADAGLDKWNHGTYFWQRDMLEAARWVRHHTREDVRIVGFNAGLLAYFSDRTTTNLDGVVNRHALRALEERQMLAYVDDLEPTYVIDYDLYILGRFGMFWGGDVKARLQLTEEFSHHSEGLAFRIYRFR